MASSPLTSHVGLCQEPCSLQVMWMQTGIFCILALQMHTNMAHRCTDLTFTCKRSGNVRNSHFSLMRFQDWCSTKAHPMTVALENGITWHSQVGGSDSDGQHPFPRRPNDTSSQVRVVTTATTLASSSRPPNAEGLLEEGLWLFAPLCCLEHYKRGEPVTPADGQCWSNQQGW